MAEFRTEAKKLSPGLYIVATPIGNLGDISKRALETLAGADLIACEDTRVTAKLLNAFLIKKPLISYHEHNGAEQRPRILSDIQAGKAVVLVSDAGTPLISDPGYRLVSEAHELALKVTSIPGASAVTTALSLAGLATDRFLFMGFPPNKQKARQDWFAEERNTRATLVFYENAKRLPQCLADAVQMLGSRKAAVCRELSKKFEEVVQDDLMALVERYERTGPPKGEVVVIIEGAAKPDHKSTENQEELDRVLKLALENMSVKSAAAFVAELLEVKRKQVYSRALELSHE